MIMKINTNISGEQEGYNLLHLRHSRWIKALARKLSSSDNDLADDLEQEGNIALWSIAKADRLVKGEDFGRYIHSSIRYTMRRFLRWERRQRAFLYAHPA